MKKVILFLAIAFSSITIQAQEIKWMTFDEAIEAQKKNPKPIFMDVYTDWCGPCKLLDKKTFHNKEMVDYISANYYAVKFNAEGNDEINFKGIKYTNPDYVAGKKGQRNSQHKFGDFLNIQGYPSMYVINAKGEITANLIGYREATGLLYELKNGPIPVRKKP